MVWLVEFGSELLGNLLKLRDGRLECVGLEENIQIIRNVRRVDKPFKRVKGRDLLGVKYYLLLKLVRVLLMFHLGPLSLCTSKDAKQMWPSKYSLQL